MDDLKQRLRDVEGFEPPDQLRYFHLTDSKLKLHEPPLPALPRPVASRKKPLEIGIIASAKKPHERLMKSGGDFPSFLRVCGRVSAACAEDRATLESDPSAVAGEYTEGQGEELCPLFFCPSGTP